MKSGGTNMKKVTITIHSIDSDRPTPLESWQCELETGNTHLTAGRIIEGIRAVAKDQGCRVGPLVTLEEPEAAKDKKWDGNIKTI
jgi:hypothetical protein